MNVELIKDYYADHVATKEDIKCNYMVKVYSDILEEDEDPKALAKRLKKLVKEFNSVIKKLEKIK